MYKLSHYNKIFSHSGIVHPPSGGKFGIFPYVTNAFNTSLFQTTKCNHLSLIVFDVYNCLVFDQRHYLLLK